MIIGILLAITLSISLASLGIILLGLTGAIQENIATGAAIGTREAISYSAIILATSLIIVFFLALILKNKK